MDIFLSILSLVGFVALTGLTGLFVAIEFAITGLERATIDSHVKQVGDRRALAIKEAHNNLSFELSGAQLGITITTLATGYLAEPVLSTYFTPLLTLVGLSEELATSVALILALIVATLLSMVYGELVPKNLAITKPLATARFVVPPVQIFNKVFSWFIKALNWAANALVRKLGVEPADELASARTPQELGALVRNSANQGKFDQSEAQMLDRSLKFGESDADEFMTPRSTIVSLQADDTVNDLLRVAIDTGYSRFPVVNGDLDETLGVVHVKSAFGVPRDKRSTTQVIELARTVPVVPESLDGDAVLKAVRSAGSQVVLIADEYGGTAGFVTMEDVVEEILGEVYDEHDDAYEEQEYRKAGTHSWDVSGLARVDELPDKIGYYAPEGPYESLGGLIMATLGAIPEGGETVLLPETDRDYLDEFESGLPGRWIARVTQMDGMRIDRALLTPITNEEAEAMQQ